MNTEAFPKPGRAESKPFEVRQPVKLEDGFYIGWFARYGMPKLMKKFNSEDMETKIFLQFLITHSINERPLPRFSVANAFPTYKRVYVPSSGISSAYFAFEHALLASQYSKDELINAPDESVPSLDKLIGRPVVMKIELAKKSTREGIYNNQIRDFQPLPTSAREAMIAFRKSFEMARSEKGFAYITKPEPEYDETNAFDNAVPAELEHGYNDIPDDEIPF